ncbi:helix-turn-helix domain-containing protein [Sporanaerobacter acetigenes]|uniref:helix-turn-helix domain-containing protein n=1 Tax=Sporanaerobacter acetigenes TaxID=165813 RepID=UPI003319990F
MNYIKELNAFYDWLETNSLSTSAIALWHALMHINNKTGWAEEFGVAASVLCIKTGLSDRTIRNARNELKQKGRIDWRSRKGNQSAIYKMISFMEEVPEIVSSNTSDKPSGNDIKEDDEKELSEINADNVSGSTSGNTSGSVSGNASTLNKLNETKLNDINTSTNTKLEEDFFDEEFKELAQLYQKCGFDVNGLTPDWLMDLKERFGFEWVKNAILEAEKQGARRKAYVEKILSNWQRWGGMKLSTDNKPDANRSAATPAAKKTKFHNFKQRTDNYSADQLEDIARRKREEYFKKAQEGGN